MYNVHVVKMHILHTNPQHCHKAQSIVHCAWHSFDVGSKPPDLIPVTVYSERMFPLVVLHINMTVGLVCTFTFSMHIHIQYAHSHSHSHSAIQIGFVITIRLIQCIPILPPPFICSFDACPPALTSSDTLSKLVVWV